MSIVTRPRRPNLSLESSSVSESIPSTPPTSSRRTLVAEAPESRATISREAPDHGRRSASEAPDAGEGRSAYLEHEFTRGRSQS